MPAPHRGETGGRGTLKRLGCAATDKTREAITTARASTAAALPHPRCLPAWRGGHPQPASIRGGGHAVALHLTHCNVSSALLFPQFLLVRLLPCVCRVPPPPPKTTPMSDLAHSAATWVASLTTPAGQARAVAALCALQARRVTLGLVSVVFLVWWHVPGWSVGCGRRVERLQFGSRAAVGSAWRRQRHIFLANHMACEALAFLAPCPPSSLGRPPSRLVAAVEFGVGRWGGTGGQRRWNCGRGRALVCRFAARAPRNATTARGAGLEVPRPLPSSLPLSLHLPTHPTPP